MADGGIVLEVGQLVFDLYVFPGGELREQSQLLKQMADMLLAHLYPVFDLETLGIAVIEHHGTAIVVAIAYDITAKSTLSLT